MRLLFATLLAFLSLSLVSALDAESNVIEIHRHVFFPKCSRADVS